MDGAGLPGGVCTLEGPGDSREAVRVLLVLCIFRVKLLQAKALEQALPSFEIVFGGSALAALS